MGVRNRKTAELVEIPKRNEIYISKQEGIFNNGKGNNYPEFIENLINASVTAKSAAGMLSGFISGNGFELGNQLNALIIYEDILGEITMLELLKEISNSLSRHDGAYLNIQYNANAKVTGIKVLPYKNCRIGKTDSFGYSGKIHVNEKWGKGHKKTDTICVDVFNPVERVVLKQISASGGIKNYRGQIAFLSMDKTEIYPTPLVDVCRDDADTEAQISSFKNGELRGGFFAKYIVHHSEFESENDAIDLKNKMQTLMSGEHEASLLLLSGTFDSNGEWISNSNIKIEKLEQNIDDKIFEGYEKTIANNIRKAFKVIPKILIDSEDSGIFGQSGAAFIEAIKFYNMQTSEYRTSVSQFIRKILSNHSDPQIAAITNYNIKPLNYGIVDISGSAGA